MCCSCNNLLLGIVLLGNAKLFGDDRSKQLKEMADAQRAGQQMQKNAWAFSNRLEKSRLSLPSI